MIRLFFIFAIALFITLFALWSNVRAEPKIPALNQLIAPPSIIEYQREPHAVFNYGGLQFLYVIKKMPTPFPQCDAVQYLENELVIIGADPFGYIFFTELIPTAFKTDHSLHWDELVQKTCIKEGCK